MSSPSTTMHPSSPSETYLLTPPISPLSISSYQSTSSSSPITHEHRKRSPSYFPICPEKSLKLPPISLSPTPSRPIYAIQRAYTLSPMNTSRSHPQIQLQHRRCVSLPAPAPASGARRQILFPCRNKSFAITSLLPTPPSSPSASSSSSSVSSASSVSEAMTSRQLPLPTSKHSVVKRPNCTLALLPQSIVNHLMTGGRVAIKGKDGKTSFIRKAGAESVAAMQQRQRQQVIFDF